MTPPQQVAEPVDEPQAALIAICTCGRRIWRLAEAAFMASMNAPPLTPSPAKP